MPEKTASVKKRKEYYTVADKGNRKVTYVKKENLEAVIIGKYATQSVGEPMTREERVRHRPGTAARTQESFGAKKPGGLDERKAEEEGSDDSDSMPMAEQNFSSDEETEVIINEKGEIVGERLRTDLPR